MIAAADGRSSIVASPAPALDQLVEVPVVHHLVPRPWGEQHLVTAGRDGGPSILLVHGWPQHWLAWRHVIAALAPYAQVVAVDLRGFGWSSTTVASARRTTVEALADDLAAALDHLGIGRAVLAAHDWGGWIGFRALERHPDRFAAYAALAIMPPWLELSSLLRHFGGWSYVFPMAAAGQLVARRPHLVRALVDHSTTVPVWDTADGGEAIVSYQTRVADPAAAAMTQRLYASFVSRELRRALGRRSGPLAIPAIMVLGEHETISLPDHWWRRTHAGEIELVTVPGARHWLAEEAPEATAAILLRLLDRNGADPKKVTPGLG